VQVDISGFPSGVSRVLLRHYRIDDPQQFLDCVEKNGITDQPSLEQYAAFEAAGELQKPDSPKWISCRTEKRSFI
jgi:hypothetical protein